MHRIPRAAALATFVLLCATPATAQRNPFEAGVQIAAASMPHFEGSDFGVGGRLAWHVDDLIAFEGELNLFPGNYPDEGRAFSRRRVEGLFGLTAGLRFDRMRPFAKFRAGFVDVGQAPEPFPCIRIFPAPLECTLAEGRTLAAMDVGGGIDLNVTPRTFVRVEAGDRIVKYPGPAFDPENVRRDEAFFGHAFRFAAGAGVRF